jgi:hypothetical protein
VRNHRPAAEKDARQIGFNHEAPIGSSLIGNLSHSSDAGVVNQDIDAAESIDRRPDELVHVRLVRNVGPHRQETRSPAKSGFCIRQRRPGTAADRHLRPVVEKRRGNRSADAARPASDDRDAPVELWPFPHGL